MKITSRGPKLSETQPGQVLTSVLFVTNLTGQKHEFLEEVKIPAGWRLIIPSLPFELAAGEGDARIVSYAVPPAAAAGRYQITYAVKNREDVNLTAEQRIDVVVLSLAKIEVRRQEAPRYVVAGKEYRCDFVIVNHSNARSRIALEIDSKKDYPAKTDRMKFRLEAGESKKIIITVETDPDVRQKISHHLNVTAKALDDFDQGEVTANDSSRVEIIPRITGVEERYHKLPVQLETRGFSEEDIGLQAQLSGYGTLTENGDQQIDFLFRWPEAQGKSIFGQDEEYRLSLNTNTWAIHLGERSYSLSPLTEQYRYGLGAEGRLSLHKLNIGAHYVETRWQPKENQRALRFGYRGSEKWGIDLHYLRKKEPDSLEAQSRKSADADIWSIQAFAAPVNDVGVELEYGIGWQRCVNHNNIDDAWRIEAQGRYRRLSGRLRVIHAGSDYPGYYRDLDYKLANVVLPLWRGLRFQINYSNQKRYLDLIPPRLTALQEQNYRFGLDYGFKIGTRLSLEHRNRQRKDRFIPPKFDYERNDMRLSLSHAFKRLSFYASADLGKTDDRLAHQTQVTGRYRVSTHYAPTAGQRYSGYFQSERRSFVSIPERRQTIGLNAWYKLTDRASFETNFQQNQFGDASSRKQVDVTLSCQLYDDQQILLQGRRLYYRMESNNAQHKTSIMLTYTTPFDIPVSRRTNIGVLHGRLYNLEHPQGQGIPDAIISVNGATAVTDKKGNFRFPSLNPGTHHLQVDQEAIGFNRVIMPKTPLEITIKKGAETKINLGVVLSATLKGRVVVFASKAEDNDNDDKSNLIGKEERDNQDNNLVIEASGKTGGGKLGEEYGLTNIFVELKSESEIHRRVTNQNGNFLFENLRPGNWTLAVYENNLPAFHYLEQKKIEFHLHPGGEEEVLVKVLPQMRSINIIDTGEISIEEEAEE